VQPPQRLDAWLLVGADQVDAALGQRACLLVQVADLGNLGAEGVAVLGVSVEPVAALVRL
jgi:hypothetical protein